MKEVILKEAKELFPTVRAHRRYLHQNPEIGFEIPTTRAYVRKQLELMGYAVQNCGKAGLVAIAGNKTDGKVLLLRADMDALPIQEESGVDFGSNNGSMHACGHDMHTAILLGAAQILKKHEEELPGQVKLMFQPAEEILDGAFDMISAGVLDSPRPDGGMMIHAAAAAPLPAGTVMISAPGINAPSADYFTITVTGMGCHGSMPHEGIDALNAGCHILIGLQEINARELSITDQAVLTIGTFHAGTASNAIADKAVLGGTIRCFDDVLREKIKARMCQISEGIASAFRAKTEVSFDTGAPTLKNDAAMCAFAENALAELLGNSAIPVSKIANGKPSAGGSEDFAYVSQQIPTVMLSLAAGEPKNGYTYPLHHPKTTFDESAMENGVAALAYCAWRFLLND